MSREEWMRKKKVKLRQDAPGQVPPGYVLDGQGVLRMTPELEARSRKLNDAFRPKKPPSDREIIEARKKGYFASNDLVTEGALKASLSKHPHSLDVMELECPWCEIERRIFATGHMASLNPQPEWWIQFVRDREGPQDCSPRQWTDLKITRSDGRWWVVRVSEPLDLHEPGTGGQAYRIEPWGAGLSCRPGDLPRLNVRRLREGGSSKDR